MSNKTVSKISLINTGIIKFLQALQNYMDLDCRGNCQAMYVWIDGTGEKLRGKTRTFEKSPKERFHVKLVKIFCAKRI